MEPEARRRAVDLDPSCARTSLKFPGRTRPADLIRTTVSPFHRLTAADSCSASARGIVTGVRLVSDVTGSAEV